MALQRGKGGAVRRGGVAAALFAASAALAAPTFDATPDAAEQAARRAAAGSERHWVLSGLGTVDILGNARGGIRRGTRGLAELAVAAAYDGGNGWTGVVSAQYVNGAVLSGQLSGDIQTASNIEAIGATRIYEVWAGRDLSFGGGGADAVEGGVKFGLIDLNADFDVQEAGGLFLNSSTGIAPEFSHTGRNGPSIFPTTALAVTGYVAPAPGWRIDLGAFDGVPGNPAHPRRFAIHLGGGDGALLVAQVTRRWGEALRVEGGAWHYTAAFDALDDRDASGAPRRLRASRGVYGLVEGRLLGHDDGAKNLSGDDKTASGRRLTAWVRLGVADDRVDAISSYVGGGLVLAPPFATRASDSVGVAVVHAGFGGPARRATPGLRGGETIFEASYHASLGRHLGIQPDLQYIVHPGLTPGARDALVVGVRLSFAAAH